MKTHFFASMLTGLLCCVSPSVLAAVLSVELGKQDDEGNAFFLNHSFDSGWTTTRDDRVVFVSFKDILFDISNAPESASELSTHLADFEHIHEAGSTILKFEMNCNCSLLIEGNDAEQVSFRFLRNTPVHEAISSPVESSNEGQVALMPLPPKKPSIPNDQADVVEGQPATPVLNAEQARSRLLEQLQKAAAAGIVEFGPSTSESVEDDIQEVAPEERLQLAASPTDAADPEDQSEPTHQIAPSPVPPDAKRGVGGMVAEQIASVQSHPDLSDVCHPKQVFSFPDVSQPDEYINDLGRLRSQIVGEFDKVDDANALSLVRLQLAAGFTAEAKSVLTAFALSDPTAKLYNDIASLLEGSPLDPKSSLRNTNCEEDQMLWHSFLNAREGRHGESLSAEAVTGQALERLPHFLRETIATSIGLSAVEEGDWNKARVMEAMAIRSERAMGEDARRTSLLSRKIAEWNGDTAKRSRLLLDALDGDPEISAEALLTLGNDHAADSEANPVGFGEIEIELETLARLKRGTALGAASFETYLRNISKNAPRDEVVEELVYGLNLGLLPEDRHAVLLSNLFNESSDLADEQPLGLVFIDDKDNFSASLERRDFRRKLARSFADLGAPELAESYLRPGDIDKQTALTLSASYFDAGLPEEARDLAGKTSETAARSLIEAVALVATNRAELARPILATYEWGSIEPDTEAHLWQTQFNAALIRNDVPGAIISAEQLHALRPSSGNSEALELLRSGIIAGDRNIDEDVQGVTSGIFPDLVAIEDVSEIHAQEIESSIQVLEQELGQIEAFLNDG